MVTIDTHDGIVLGSGNSLPVPLTPSLKTPGVSGPSLIGTENMHKHVYQVQGEELTVVVSKDLFLGAKQDPGYTHESPSSAPSLH